MSYALAFSLFFLAMPPASQDSPDRHGPTGRGSRKPCSIHLERRVPICLDGFCGPPFRGCFFVDVVTNWDFFGPPIPLIPFGAGPFDPFCFGIMPVVAWNEPIFVRPALPPVRPEIVQPGEPHGAVQIVPPTPARTPTTDVPERVVEDLLGRRRPNLAQRAQAARLEAGGDSMFRAGYFARAAERFQQALAYTPDDDDAQFKRGAALAAAGHHGEALRVLREALRTRPDWPFVQHDLTTLFPDEAAIAKVLDSLEREARRPDPEGDPQFLRAYIMYFSGRRAEAEAIFRNPPGNVVPPYYQTFQQAIERGGQ
jgi:Tetratricopeptide repeat